MRSSERIAAWNPAVSAGGRVDLDLRDHGFHQSGARDLLHDRRLCLRHRRGYPRRLVPASALAGAATRSLPSVFAVELAVARQLYQRDHLDQVLATFGIILIFDELVHIVWGPEGYAIAMPAALGGLVAILPGVELPAFRVVIIAVGLAVAAALYIVVTRTKVGMLIRAGASNRDMVSALGVNIDLLFALVFAGGAVLAGLAGLMIAPITEANIGMGNDILIVAFVVIIIGGIGSIRGAFIAALLVGLIDTMGRSFLDGAMKLVLSDQNAETAAPALSAMLIYVLMAGILYFRPQGLFPPRGR